MTTLTSIFISYSRKDYHFVERLRTSLSAARIPYWIDHEGLLAGTPNWERTIRDAIRESSALILVASPNAYESNYVQDEIAIAQMYNRTIYPVWANGEHWIGCVPMGMGKSQYIDLRGINFETNFSHLLQALSGKSLENVRVMPPGQLARSGGTRRNPYKGLEAFQEKDAGDFFGRSAAISQLVTKFKERALGEKERLLAVIGASGSGKSSVVLAGLIPRLKGGVIAGSENWLYIPPITPGNAPIRALTRALNRAAPNNPFTVIEQELRHPNGQGLANFAYSMDQRVVLYIDQFEELFMPGVNADERDQYISLILQAVNESAGNLTVILTLRADFYDRPTNYLELGILISQNSYTLLPMSLRELREAVESPTLLPDIGLAFESGLVGDIVFELREAKNRMALAGALPLLQFTLHQLYEHRDQTNALHILTLKAYAEMGGVSGALGRYAESIFAAADESVQSRLGRVFFRLIHVDERGEATRERAYIDDFEDDVDSVRLIDIFVKARLLVVNRDEQAATVEVAHEALLRNWRRLTVWIEGAADSKRVLQKVEIDAAYWYKHGKPRDQYRYSHEQLIEIDAIRSAWGVSLSPLVSEFLQPEIERLIEDLRGEVTHGTVKIAHERLLAIGSGAVPALIAALGHTHASVRRNAVRVLGQVSDERAVEPLISALSDIDRDVRKSVAAALGRLGDSRALPPLISALRDTDRDTRKSAAAALGQLGDLRAVEPLLVALNDVRESVRSDVAKALGQLGDTRAVEPLIAALGESDNTVRKNAAQALGDLGDSRAVEPLISLLRDANETLRASVAAALGRLDDYRVFEPLILALQDPREYVRGHAAAALGKLGDAKAVEPLMSALGDTHEYVRGHAAAALGELGDTKAVEPLISALSDVHSFVRWHAAAALGELGDTKAVEPLISALGDTHESVRGHAAESLGKLQNVQAIEPLSTLLGDSDKSVRKKVEDALGKLHNIRSSSADPRL